MNRNYDNISDFGQADRGKEDLPLVSVCMPAYNAGATIREAIASVLSQKVPLELIVVLDGTDEETQRVLEEHRGDSRVKVLRNASRMGAAGSRNIAVAHACAPYVAFLDADDLWAEGKLEKQLAVLEQSGRILCCTARELLLPDGSHTGRVIPVSRVIRYEDLLKTNSINCSSVLVHTQALKRFPMEHEDSHEDYITWLKILREFGPADGLNEPLLYYRLSSSGKSGTKLKSARMTFRVYRYMGFSFPKSVYCFLNYAVRGVGKYLGSRLHR